MRWFSDTLDLQILELEEVESLGKLNDTQSDWLCYLPPYSLGRSNSNSPVGSIGRLDFSGLQPV